MHVSENTWYLVTITCAILITWKVIKPSRATQGRHLDRLGDWLLQVLPGWVLHEHTGLPKGMRQSLDSHDKLRIARDVSKRGLTKAAYKHKLPKKVVLDVCAQAGLDCEEIIVADFTRELEKL